MKAFEELCEHDRIERLRMLARSIPGAEVRFGVLCRATRPEPPDVPNLQMVDCTRLLNHDGGHSWER